MAITTTIYGSFDLAGELSDTNLRHPFFQGSVNAHELRITVLNGGVAADLSGASASAEYLLSDGSSIEVSGTISGNTVVVLTPSGVYGQVGNAGITVYLTQISGGTNFVRSIFHSVVSVIECRTDNVINR